MPREIREGGIHRYLQEPGRPDLERVVAEVEEEEEAAEGPERDQREQRHVAQPEGRRLAAHGAAQRDASSVLIGFDWTYRQVGGRASGSFCCGRHRYRDVLDMLDVDALFDTVERSAFRLEPLPRTGQPIDARYLADGLAMHVPWFDAVRRAVGAGRAVRRVRVVDRP